MIDTNVVNYPKIGELFISEKGILGNKRRVIFLEHKQCNDIEFKFPLERSEVLCNMSIFDSYSQKVRALSRINYINGYKYASSNGLVVDHKISVYSCFLNDVSIEDASNASNLRVITSKANSKKHTKNYLDKYNFWIVKKYNFTHNPKKGDMYLAEVRKYEKLRKTLYK
jgi:hypothetical protein